MLPSVVVRGEELSFVLLPKKIFGGWHVAVKDPSFNILVSRLGGEATWEKNNLLISHFLMTAPVNVTSSLIIEDSELYLPVEELVNIVKCIFYVILKEGKKEPALTFVPQILGVKIDNGQVIISATGEVQFSSMTLEDPLRLVLDIQGAVVSPEYKKPPDINELVNDLQIVQFQNNPDVVRVTMALPSSTDYLIPPRENQTQICINVMNDQLTNAPSTNDQLPQPTQSSSPARLSDTTEQPVSDKKIARLVGVSVKEEKTQEGVKTIIVMQTSGQISFVWRRLKSPDNRIFFDFKDCILDIPDKEINLKGITVHKIKGGQFEKEPPVARIVAYLKDRYDIHVSIKENYQVVLEIGSKELTVESLATFGSGTTVLGKEFTIGEESTQGTTGRGIIVVLDPGHGGSDTGALNPSNGMMEKELTLDIALRLEKLLRKDGFGVILTRKTDVDVCGYKGGEKEELGARVNVANQKKADLFLSIHINASYSSSPNGSSVHWYKALDLPLAQVLHKHLASKTSFLDRGISRNRFYVVRHTQMPAVLLELGFLTNPGDETLLAREHTRQKLASAISDSLIEFVSGVAFQPKRSSSRTPLPSP